MEYVYGAVAILGMLGAFYGLYRMRRHLAVARVEAQAAKLDKLVAEKVAEIRGMSDEDLRSELDRLLGR